MKTVSGYDNIIPDLDTEYLVETPGGSTANVTQAELDSRYTPVTHNTDTDNPHAVSIAQIGAEPANSNIQAHVVSAHAPANAQKNSDILQSEIEEKLTGTVSTHVHASEHTHNNKSQLDLLTDGDHDVRMDNPHGITPEQIGASLSTHNHAGVYEPADATILKDGDIGVTVASQGHNHNDIYEPVDATLLRDADIGVSVASQGHNHAGTYEPADATILKDADIGVTVASHGHDHNGVYEPADATILKNAAIGVSVAAYVHAHDALYYTETELNAGQLDTRYYTETELDAGQLDTRYYTETEIDTALSGKSNTTHNHNGVYEPADLGIQTHIASTNNPHGVTAAQVGAEAALGNPDVDGKVLTSKANGIRTWEKPSAGAKGGSENNEVFWENDTVVTASYAITEGKNAMSAGPITIGTGVTVTVPTGSVWTVI